MYIGCDFSIDGLTLLIGAKLAGIKLIIPWTGAERMIPNYKHDTPTNMINYPFLIGACFIASSYILNRNANN